MTALVGIDVGTTGVRCLAVDEAGKALEVAVVEYPIDSPRPGWSEQQPEVWWRATREAIAQIDPAIRRDVVGIGLTGQMHGAVFLDSSDRVIRPALLWNDQRTAAQCRTIDERVGPERLSEITGNPALTGFQAPKVLWLRDEEAQSYKRVARLLLPKDYIRLQLSGEAATDASDASGTLLLDLSTRGWSHEVLDALEIPFEWLPVVLEGPQESGRVSAAAAHELGLPPSVPIAAGAGDNAAAAVGNGVIREELASCSIGTSGSVFSHCDELRRDPSGRVHACCHAVPDRYHLMGATLAAGASLRWWRDIVRSDYESLAQLAAEAPLGSEGLLFLPYLTGERSPHLDPLARGAFIGLSSRHSAAHLTRALMEGVAFSLRDSITIIRDLGVMPAEIRATGGGARSDLWRQMLADVLGCRVVRTVADQGPAYGAALLAGVTAGIHRNVGAAEGWIAVRPDACDPDPARSAAYAEYYAIYHSLYAANRSAMHALSNLTSLGP